MKVLVIANPRSGRGRGAVAAAEAAEWLGSEAGGGHEADLVQGGREGTEGRFAGCDAAVIVGGDGSVHHSAKWAVKAGVPVYHLPYGNENLFAREFGMDRSLERLGRALNGNSVAQVDLGMIGESSFVIMASFGPDASVVHRLSRTRTRATGHLAYIAPFIQELVHPCFPRLSVEADGRSIVRGQRGVLIVANSRQYALRLDPLHAASMTDGLLDVLFMPCRGLLSLAPWMWACVGRRAERRRGAVCARAREIGVITERGPVPYQIDGEAPAADGGILRDRIEIRVEAGALPVLLPAEYQRRTVPPMIAVSTGSAPNS